MKTDSVNLIEPGQAGGDRRGFTLVELLVVIAIIGILVALLLPAVQSAREAARRTQCANHFKQMGLAVQNYHDGRRELPPMRVSDHQQTWLVLILPYMEEGQVADQWDSDLGCFYLQRYAFRTTPIQGYLCPSQDHDAMTVEFIPDSVHGHPRNDPSTGRPWEGAISDYRAVAGSTCIADGGLTASGSQRWINWLAFDNSNSHHVDGPIPQCDNDNVDFGGPTGIGVISFKARTSLKNITDGTSKTLLCGEVGRRTSERGHAFNGDHLPGVWIGELSPFCDRCGDPEGDSGFGSVHPGVTMFGMCDGSVQPISRDVDLKVLDRMATRAGGETYDINGTALPCQHTSL